MLFPQAILNRAASGLLICAGSRHFPRHGQAWAGKAAMMGVERAKAKGWAIAVGDAAGADQFFIQAALDRKVPLIILGSKKVGMIRNAEPAAALTWLVPGDYTTRDYALAQLGTQGPNGLDKVGFYGVWNGNSPGTKGTAEQCRQRCFPGILVTPSGNIVWNDEGAFKDGKDYSRLARQAG